MIGKACLIGVAVVACASFTGPAAKAADGEAGCGGTLVEYTPVVVGGETVGQLQLYYNASAGTNCAIMLHGGPTWGVLKDTGVLLAKSNARNGPYEQAGYQRSNYRYQAGPIRTPGAGKCVYAGGGIDYKGAHRTVYTGFHCG